jgi:DNA-binding transcriptional LysR family regulator
MTDFHALPPLAALRAFAAFVEAGSLVRAGAALNVSHAAVSQQLRALETHLGVALFDRSGQALRLTAEGQRLAEAVVSGFEAMGRAVEELTGRDAGRPLMVTTTSSFAAGWLLPRLADFRARHPGIDLMIDPSPEVKPLAPGGFDVALRYGAGADPRARGGGAGGPDRAAVAAGAGDQRGDRLRAAPRADAGGADGAAGAPAAGGGAQRAGRGGERAGLRRGRHRRGAAARTARERRARGLLPGDAAGRPAAGGTGLCRLGAAAGGA